MIGDLLWSPAENWRTSTRIGQYMSWLTDTAERTAAGTGDADLEFDTQGDERTLDYASLWQWSTTDLEGFWRSIWQYFQVGEPGTDPEMRPGPGPGPGPGSGPEPEKMLAHNAMPGAIWMPDVRLNYAEQALRRRGPDPAIIARSQTRGDQTLSWDQLAEQVGAARAGLQRLGVGSGDRVAAYLPNVPETVVAFLATASLGAIWSSCAPEFGVQAVVDRFSQIQPKVLLAVDGYRYGVKDIDRRDELAQIRASLPTVRHTIVVPYLHTQPVPGCIGWSDLVAEPGALLFEPMPANGPLYVLFSSGTTGMPKPIVHGHGGILLEHLKVLGLHADLGHNDRFLWFTTTGWMMWNYLISGLLVGSTIVLFDGDPNVPDASLLWSLAAEFQVTWFGAGAPLLMHCAKVGLEPAAMFDLHQLRAIGSTGAPLSPEGFRWVSKTFGPQVMLSSISGGTDICSAFVGGCPAVPVWEGEISCRYLGAAVASFNEQGHPNEVGEQGELVITQPMPSMPVGFWGDDDGSKYRLSYFEAFPGVWRHGDWITFTDHGSCVISGRSDATLNRGGVRIGTAEIYRVVEGLPGIDDSLIVHLEDSNGGTGQLVLFVVMAGHIDDQVTTSIRAALRQQLSPRHVPDEIYQLSSIPTTLSGKKLELPVKKMLTGSAPDDVASRGALRRPEAIDEVVAIADRRRGLAPQ